MMHRHYTIAIPAALFFAVACQDTPAPTAVAPDRPNFWAGGEQCPGMKFTGGGRIDPPDHLDAADQEDGPSGDQMVGKVTFGFNVFLGANGNGDCVVKKGEIQVVHHQPDYPFQVTWHIAVHNGVNEEDGQEVPARTYISGHGGWCVVVGPTSSRMHAVTFGVKGTDRNRMTACDNGEPGSSPGYGPDGFRWETQFFNEDTQLQYLTGGNIQAH